MSGASSQASHMQPILARAAGDIVISLEMAGSNGDIVALVWSIDETFKANGRRPMTILGLVQVPPF